MVSDSFEPQLLSWMTLNAQRALQFSPLLIVGLVFAAGNTHSNNDVHLSCTHQRPDCSHDTY